MRAIPETLIQVYQWLEEENATNVLIGEKKMLTDEEEYSERFGKEPVRAGINHKIYARVKEFEIAEHDEPKYLVLSRDYEHALIVFLNMRQKYLSTNVLPYDRMLRPDWLKFTIFNMKVIITIKHDTLEVY